MLTELLEPSWKLGRTREDLASAGRVDGSPISLFCQRCLGAGETASHFSLGRHGLTLGHDLPVGGETGSRSESVLAASSPISAALPLQADEQASF